MKRLMILTIVLGFAWQTNPVHAQQPDTLRILDVSTNPGQTFWVSLYMRNIEFIGGYGIRMVYDASLIEPTTFVHGSATDLVHELLRGTAMEIHGGAVPGDGVATFLAVELTNSPPFLSPGSGVAVRMKWRALPSSAGQLTQIRFEGDSVFPGSFNTMSDLDGTRLIFPVLNDGVVSIGTCVCPHQGDFNEDGLLNAVDLAFEIDQALLGIGSIQDPGCDSPRTDIDDDGDGDGMDVNIMIDHVFFGGSEPEDPCAD